MSIKNVTSRFTAPNGAVLRVNLRKGRKAINVSSTYIAPGSKALTGTRSSFNAEESDAFEKATTAFNELKSKAVAKGWTERTRQSGNRSAFDEIPTPDTAAPAKTDAKVKAKK